MGRLLVCLLFLGGVLGAVGPVWAQKGPWRVALILERGPEDIYFAEMVRLIGFAANQLNAELNVVWGRGNHIQLTEQVTHLLASPQKPHAVLMNPFKGMESRVLPLCEKAEVNVLIYESDARGTLGEPRTTFKHFLGQILGANTQAGYDLASQIVKAATPNALEKVPLVALMGQEAHPAAIERRQGLARYLKENPHVELQQERWVPSWDGQRAFVFVTEFLRRQIPMAAIWAASDGIALGAAKALTAGGKMPGGDVVLGGVDWTREGLKAVQDKTLHVSMGGQILLPMWALILMYDHFQGQDFKNESLHYTSPFFALDKQNIDRYQRLTSSTTLKRVNFRQFTKTHNPSLKNYDFSLINLLATIEKDQKAP